MTTGEKSGTSYKHKYGYKGTETALNGLTSWLYDNHKVPGTVRQQYQKYIYLIIEYSKAEMPLFKGRQKRPQNKALAIAKIINENKKFNHFVKWVKSQTIINT